MKTLNINSRERCDFLNITHLVQRAIEEEGVNKGVITVFVPHTTAGVTINENADPDVVTDMKASLEALVPWHNNYLHSEGNSAAHLKTLMTGTSVQIPVSNGKLQLGTWQGIFFCEYDGPRSRNVIVS